MAYPYRQFPIRRKPFVPPVSLTTQNITGQIRVAANPKLGAFWQHPTNQPWRRRQVMLEYGLIETPIAASSVSTQNITGQLRVANNPSLDLGWQKTQQFLRNRVPKRQMPIEHNRSSFLVQGVTTQTITGQLRVSANPSLQPTWKQPTNQYLRNRVPKRQMPYEILRDQFLVTITTTQTITGQVRVSTNPALSPSWKQPTNQYLRSRVPKRQMPVEHSRGTFLATSVTTQSITGQLRVSANPALNPFWKQPTNQPLRSRVPKRQMPTEDTKGSFLVTLSTTRTITGQVRVSANPAFQLPWFRPTNQPLRSRVLKRQQPQRYFIEQFVTSATNQNITGRIRVAANPALGAYWQQPTNQYLRNRVPRRQQPPEIGRAGFVVTFKTTQTIAGQLRVSTNPSLAPTWKQPVNQYLRNRVPKRQMPYEHNRATFLVTLATTRTITGQVRVSTNPSVAPTWKQPTNQPLRNRIPKRQQPQRYFIEPIFSSTRNQNITGQIRVSTNPKQSFWKQPVNQPLKSRVPKRQQPNNYGRFIQPSNTTIQMITGQVRVYQGFIPTPPTGGVWGAAPLSTTADFEDFGGQPPIIWVPEATP